MYSIPRGKAVKPKNTLFLSEREIQRENFHGTESKALTISLDNAIRGFRMRRGRQPLTAGGECFSENSAETG